MKRRRFLSIMAGAALPLHALPASAGGMRTFQWTGTALGADASITFAGLTQPQAQRLVEQLLAEIERLEALFSLYRNDSAVVRLNNVGRLDNPSHDMVRLLELCARLHRLTRGKFDPTVQPVWQLLARTGGSAGDAMREEAVHRTGWQHVRFDRRSVAFARGGMALTLNGVAQGYITDCIAQLLRGEGIANVLVRTGEISVLGERLPGRSWRVAIAEREDQPAEEFVELSDTAIATSSPRGLLLDPEGRTGHIVDPLTGGTPAFWRRVSVIHPSAAVADGLSTGFCLMPRGAIEKAAASVGARLILA